MASTDIILILDASGSMQPLINDTIGGFNKFINEQKQEPGDAYVTLTTFDTGAITERYQAKPLKDVPVLDYDGYFGGHGQGTPLLDAVGREIIRYEALPIKADKTLFVIDTDGEENSSVEWTFLKVKALIERAQSKGWGFVFLGANDSAWQGERIGASVTGQTIATGAGVAAKYGAVSAGTSFVRSSELSAHASSAMRGAGSWTGAKPPENEP